VSAARRLEWLSAAEIAGLGLPGAPSSKQGVLNLADADGWRARVDNLGRPLVRPRAGRGGGAEYHWSLLPAAARAEMARRGMIGGPIEEPARATKPAKGGAIDCWQAWNVASDAAKERAAKRAAAVRAAEGLIEALGSVQAGVDAAAKEANVSRSALFGWRERVKLAPRDQWAPLLLDQAKAGGREAAIPEELWQFYISWWLRPKPTHSAAYRRTVNEAAKLGIAPVPSAKTFQRRVEREIPREVVLLKREGWDKARLVIPQAERSVEGLSAMDIVNLDGHKWDVFCRFEDGKIGRPMMVAIQDVYSRKMLAWRIGRAETAGLSRLVFADLFRHWGIPKKVLTDNSRAFASKWITGGAANRFRFSIKPDDPLGLLPLLGIDVHWATPRRGQAKPIERAFRDFAQTIAHHPAFHGAWTGNSVANKPENYGSRAVPIEELRAIVAAEIAEHNAREGRRTEAAGGLDSFDSVFAASYESAAVGRATAEMLELALLAADRVTADRDSGAIRLFGNRYWSSEIAHLAGQKVIVRYDPEALHEGVSVWDADSRFVARVPVWEKTGFLTADHGKARMKAEADLKKAIRAQADALNLLAPADLAERVRETAPEHARPKPGAVRPVRMRGGAVAAAREAQPQDNTDFIDRLGAAVTRLRLVDE
jgi:transposase InsO family protein